MKNIKSGFYSIIFVTSLLVLGACGDKDNVDLSEASSINEDDVTSEYYDEMVEDAYYDSVMTITEQYGYLLTTASKQLENTTEIKSAAEKYLSFAVTERVEPSTSEEYDIDEYFFKFLSNSKSSAEYYIKYSNDADSFYLDIANDYMRDALNTTEIISSILKKYGYE